MTFAATIADDLDLFDGLETATFTHRLDSSTDTISVALFRAISTAEAAASNGKYTTEDVRAHVKTSEVGTNPVPGDTITDASGVTWTILSVQRDTLATRWRLVCRLLDITDEASTLITIEAASWAKSAGGAQVATWSTSQSNVRAQIQRIAADETSETNQRQVKARFVITCEVQNLVGKSHRIVDASAVTYRILGYRNTDRIDSLYEILAEVW